MLIRHAKDLITTVPEAMDFIKQASVFDHAENLHLPDNAVATALDLAYMARTGQEIDGQLVKKAEEALKLHGLEKKANELIELMASRMAAPKKDLEKEAQSRIAVIQDLVTGINPDLEKAAELATWIKESQYADTYAVKNSELVDMYSCHGFMDKQAAEAALLRRARLSGMPEFEKAAETLRTSESDFMSPAQLQEVCKLVTGMDKQANLNKFGMNFYKEVMIVGELQKKAYSMNLTVRLAGKDIQIDKILSADYGKLEAVLGTEIATNLHGDPMTAKAVVESLPMDSQKILEAVI